MALSIPFVRKRESAPGELKQLLSRTGIVVFAEDTIDHGVKLHAVYRDLTFALILYFSAATGESSKIVMEKATEEVTGAVLEALGTSPPPVPPVARGANPLLTDLQGKSRIGIDESGKGDYFGPLTIAGVCINPEDEARLVRIGVRDSKLVNDNQAKAMAEKIRLIVGEKRFGLVQINPEKYNELYGRIRNLNKLLAWGHARVLENLLGQNNCTLAVCDQFGDESYIRKALMEKGNNVTLVQSHRAEQDLAVAAASILARDAFLRKLAEMAEVYSVRLPKGASAVVETAREFVRTYGASELGKVAKLHFKTTQKVLGGPEHPQTT